MTQHQLLALVSAAASSYPTTVVFRANDTIKSCYRNPVLLAAPNGDLLCFIEERYRGSAWRPSNSSGDHSCPDNYGIPKHPSEGGHNLGFARSSDGGRTWSAIVRLAGDLTNLRQGPVDYTNNAAVLATLPNGTRRIVWQYGTQNNPSLPQHGRLLQRHSDDSGLTWSWPPRDVSAAGAAVGLPGATPGPAQGVQTASGRLLFCAWGNRAAVPFGAKGWGNASNQANTLFYSDDMGESWRATPPIFGRGWNECFLQPAAFPNGSAALLEVARRANADASVAPADAYPPHTYAHLYFDADPPGGGAPRRLSLPATLGPPGQVRTPVCEASLLALGGALYLAHPQSETARTNLTVHRSDDGGATWARGVLVSGAESGSGYSALVALRGGAALGVAFNQWPTGHPARSTNGPGAFIRFAELSTPKAPQKFAFFSIFKAMKLIVAICITLAGASQVLVSRDCPAGQFWDELLDDCSDCPSGTYETEQGTRTKCTGEPCITGSGGPVGSTTLAGAECKECEGGYFTTSTGQTCQRCPENSEVPQCTDYGMMDDMASGQHDTLTFGPVGKPLPKGGQSAGPSQATIGGIIGGVAALVVFAVVLAMRRQQRLEAAATATEGPTKRKSVILDGRSILPRVGSLAVTVLQLGAGEQSGFTLTDAPCRVQDVENGGAAQRAGVGADSVLLSIGDEDARTASRDQCNDLILQAQRPLVLVFGTAERSQAIVAASGAGPRRTPGAAGTAQV
eukprot:g5186.t1